MPDKLFFVEGDTKPDVYFSIKDSSGAAIDVSDAGADVYFRYRQINVQDGVPASGEIALSKPNTGTDGVVMLEWGATDLDYPGDYQAEIYIDWGADIQTIPDLVDYNIRPRIRLAGETPAVPDPDVILSDPAAAIYLGMPSEEGSWRIVRSGNNLVHQRRETGIWVTKQTVSA